MGLGQGAGRSRCRITGCAPAATQSCSSTASARRFRPSCHPADRHVAGERHRARPARRLHAGVGRRARDARVAQHRRRHAGAHRRRRHGAARRGGRDDDEAAADGERATGTPDALVGGAADRPRSSVARRRPRQLSPGLRPLLSASQRWDRRVHANNMYLEVLAGAGVRAALALLWLVAAAGWLLWRRVRAARRG